MTLDAWLILTLGALMLLAMFSGAISDRWLARRQRKAADSLTRLWDDESYLDPAPIESEES